MAPPTAIQFYFTVDGVPDLSTNTLCRNIKLNVDATIDGKLIPVQNLK